MNAAGFGAFQQQVTRNQAELTDYLKDLDSWKDSISKKDSSLRSEPKNQDDVQEKLPPVRNSLLKKKKVKRKKKDSEDGSKNKDKKISGFDFRAWDKFDVDKAIKQIDDAGSSSSSYEEETDEEWEEERMKQQAIMEKDLGNGFFKNGKYEEAISCYTKGITCDPTNAVLYANRAMALLKIERFGAAEMDCTDSLILDPTYVKAYMRRATARLKIDKKELALEDYKMLLKLEPENKFAQKECDTLEKILHPVCDGIVLPVKKSLTERSKKPMVRVNIEEIDHDHVKSKLEQTIAKTTAAQSDEKKKMVAKDNELFNKFVTDSSSKPRQSTNDTENRLPHSTIRCPGDIMSPADIGKLSLTTSQKAEDQPTEKISARTVDPATSPISSPRPPTTSFQFQKDWRCVKKDMDQTYHYLQKIAHENYPKLFGECMEADVLTAILNVFAGCYIRDGLNVADHMHSLSKVKRFSMTAMLMSNKDKEVVRGIINKLSTFDENTTKDLKVLGDLYGAYV